MAQETCIVCKNEFEADEMIKYDEEYICAECKPAFFQKVKEGAESSTDFVYARFWVRFVAVFLDGIITQIVVYLLGFIVGLTLTDSPTQVTIASTLIGILIGISYETIFIGKMGATPGKMALGLKVINPDGSKVSYSKALGRYCAKIISGIILGIGYLMAAFDDEKRTLHDRICSTRVVKK